MPGFLPSVTVKSSREMAQEFCSNFLSGGVGDINKHLGTLGIKLVHKQTPLNEYNFGVNSLSTDLRDGVRLCRLVDLTAPTGEEKTLVSQTRVPAESRLQKVHNVKLALKALVKSGLLPAVHDTQSKEQFERQVKLIVDGHCESTLEFMWTLLSHEALHRLAPIEMVAKEVERARRASRRSDVGLPVTPAMLKAAGDADVPTRLLAWVASVAAVKGRKVHDLSAGLRDGVALCLLVRHYLPDVIAPELVAESASDLYDRKAAEGGIACVPEPHCRQGRRGAAHRLHAGGRLCRLGARPD